MKKIIFAVAGALAFLVYGCAQDEMPSREITYRFRATQTVTVASEEGVYIGVISVPGPCMMMRTDAGSNWNACRGIEGFEYEPGYEYVLRLDVYDIIFPSDILVCYDGPGQKYVLKNVVSKTAKTTEDIRWGQPCYDSWPGKPSQWNNVEPNVLHVIRTPDDFMRFAAWGEEQERYLDLEHYSILLVAGVSNQGIRCAGKSLTYTGGGRYEYKVEMQLLATHDAPRWQVAVLVPAIPEDADVQFTLDIK